MARRLSAHERALWSRVAATVRPLPGRAAPATHPEPAPTPAPTSAAIRPTPAPPRAAPAPPAAATLDGSWDRRMARGRLVPERVIDLHGLTLDAAHATIAAAIHDAGNARVLLVITGKGRADRPGRIRAELAHWLERPDLRPHVAALRSAHPRHGGGGAFYVILKRRT